MDTGPLTPAQSRALARGRRMLAGAIRPIDHDGTGDPATDVDARNELLGLAMPGRPPAPRLG